MINISISQYSILLPLIIGVFYFKHLDKIFKLFTFFIAYGCITEILSIYIRFQHLGTNSIYNLYTLLETICVALILSLEIQQKAIKYFMYGCVIFYIALHFIFRYNPIEYNYLNYNIKIVECLILIILSGLCIMFNSANSRVFIFYNSEFILALSFLFYFGVTLMVFAIRDLMSDQSTKQAFTQIWVIHSVVNIITNVIFAVSIWLNYRQRKSF